LSITQVRKKELHCTGCGAGICRVIEYPACPRKGRAKECIGIGEDLVVACRPGTLSACQSEPGPDRIPTGNEILLRGVRPLCRNVAGSGSEENTALLPVITRYTPGTGTGFRKRRKGKQGGSNSRILRSKSPIDLFLCPRVIRPFPTRAICIFC